MVIIRLNVRIISTPNQQDYASCHKDFIWKQAVEKHQLLNISQLLQVLTLDPKKKAFLAKQDISTLYY